MTAMGTSASFSRRRASSASRPTNSAVGLGTSGCICAIVRTTVVYREASAANPVAHAICVRGGTPAGWGSDRLTDRALTQAGTLCRRSARCGALPHIPTRKGDTHMPKYAPDSREADSWFSDEQLEKVTPADAVEDELYSPVPTQMVSNGEYMPEPQTEQQKNVEVRLRELADHASKKLGISRRSFMTTSGGTAASFIAMNEVFGKFFKVDKEEMFEPEAYTANSTPRNLFVLDDQLHIVRSSRVSEKFGGGSLRDIAAGRHTNNNPL